MSTNIPRARHASRSAHASRRALSLLGSILQPLTGESCTIMESLPSSGGTRNPTPRQRCRVELRLIFLRQQCGEDARRHGRVGPDRASPVEVAVVVIDFPNDRLAGVIEAADVMLAIGIVGRRASVVPRLISAARPRQCRSFEMYMTIEAAPRPDGNRVHPTPKCRGTSHRYRRLARSQRPTTALTGFGLSVFGTYFRQGQPGTRHRPRNRLGCWRAQLHLATEQEGTSQL